MEITLRKLCSKDLFAVAGILSKIGIKEFAGIFKGEQVAKVLKTTEDGKYEVDFNALAGADGMEIIFGFVQVLFENIPNCEKEVYRFLSGVSGIPQKEVENMPAGDFADLIVAVVKMDDFGDFLNRAFRLFK